MQIMAVSALSTFGQSASNNKCKTLPQQLSFQKNRGESFESASNGYIRSGHNNHCHASTPNGSSNGNTFLHHVQSQQQHYGSAGISVKTLVALYDYASRHSRDVGFKKVCLIF